MNGLEAIIERILEDAKLSAEQILERAEHQAQQTVEEGRVEAEKIIDEAKLQAEQLTEVKINRAESMSAMAKRKAGLHARQSVIDQVIRDAVQYLRDLSSEEKIKIYTDILRIYDDQPAGAEVQFAQVDESLARQVLDRFEGRFKLADTSGNFAGGLIIRRGRIEDNLTFDLLVKNGRSELVKAASDLLFSESVQSHSDDSGSDKERNQA